MTISRRKFLAGIAAGSAAFSKAAEQKATANKSVPNDSAQIVLHQTDLFHPHGDPDDHFDLATLFALAKLGHIDLTGLILDFPPTHRQGDPDVGALAQMNRLCASAVPAAVGANPKTARFDDAAPEPPFEESAAVRLILKTLRAAASPIKISCVGSAIDLAAAVRQEPELFRSQCAGISLNSGSALDQPEKPDLLEFNVRLNPLAYQVMFSLPCPLAWYPCWDVVERRESGERGTFYWLHHAEALAGISDGLMNFFEYMFDRSPETKWLAYLLQKPNAERWAQILTERRGMWSTASLLHLADLAVTRGGDLVRTNEIAPNDELYRMENVEASCAPDGRTVWKESSEKTGKTMFHLLAPDLYPGAMAQAVNTLFRTF